MIPLELASRCDGPATAPVVVLGNSLGTTMTMWAPQLESLGAHLRLLRWDLPGHGASREPHGPVTIDSIGDAVVALLDELGVARAGFCGVSIGGMVALSVAARCPERVERLAVGCTSAYLGAAAWDERAATVRAGGMASIADRILERWFTPEFHERRADTVTAMREDFVATDVEAYARCCEAIAAMDLRPSLSYIRCPTLIIHGADDHAILPENGAAIAASIIGSHFVAVDGAAHLATIERAAVTTSLLLDHFVTS